jgi:serine/threonine-protein kinase
MMKPETVGNYVIGEELGRGGMGVVYAAAHRVLGHPAAIKMLLPDVAGGRDQLERFFNEARATRAIAHEGIVELFDVGVAEDGRAYIAMERLTGESLAARLRAGRVSVATAVDIGRQIAAALGAAHAAGIVHRDLKPDNVFLTDRGRVKLLDFGVAKLGGADRHLVRTATGAVLGTPHYMAPEQAGGAAAVDARADLYALGCVLYRMLAGRHVFDGDSLVDVVAKHQRETPVPLCTYRPEASPQLAAIVDRLLAKAPADRFASAADVGDALAAPGVVALAPVPGDLAVTADPLTPAPRAAPETPDAAPDATPDATPAPASVRRRVVIALGIASATSVAIAVALILTTGGRRTTPTATPNAATPPDAIPPAPPDAAPATATSRDAVGATPVPRPQARTADDCAAIERELATLEPPALTSLEARDARTALYACEAEARRFPWPSAPLARLPHPSEMIASHHDAEAMGFCIRFGPGIVIELDTAPACGIAACRTGHVLWARMFMTGFEPGTDPRRRVAEACAAAGLRLDP